MKKSLMVVFFATIFMMILAYIIGGWGLILEGLKKAKDTTTSSGLMLIASFMVIGQLQVLLSEDLVDKWLKKFRGMKAVFVSVIAGGLFPGGPYIYYPFISNFVENNLPFYVFISFIFGKQIYDFSRIPIEISLVNPTIALIRNLITLPIPVIAGFLTYKFHNSSIVQFSFWEAGEKDGSNDSYT